MAARARKQVKRIHDVHLFSSHHAEKFECLSPINDRTRLSKLSFVSRRSNLLDAAATTAMVGSTLCCEAEGRRVAVKKVLCA